VSVLAKDLISRLLKLEPMERYSARETLQHPWFASWKVGEDGAPEEVRSPLIASLWKVGEDGAPEEVRSPLIASLVEGGRGRRTRGGAISLDCLSHPSTGDSPFGGGGAKRRRASDDL
jgi:serine/threonine protein kinase